MSTQVPRRRFTTDEYQRMAEAGILAEDDRVELIDGEIVQMSPMGTRHASCVDRLNAVFTARLRARAIARVQSSIILNRYTQPQPDLSLLRPRDDFYVEHHPGPADVLLVVEVVDSSGTYDRHIKLPLYARAGIPEAWVLDVVQHVVEVYRRPALRGYCDRRELRRGQRVAPVAFPRTGFAVTDLIG